MHTRAHAHVHMIGMPARDRVWYRLNSHGLTWRTAHQPCARGAARHTHAVCHMRHGTCCAPGAVCHALHACADWRACFSKACWSARRPVNVGGPALPAPHGRQDSVPCSSRASSEARSNASKQSPKPISAIRASSTARPASGYSRSRGDAAVRRAVARTLSVACRRPSGGVEGGHESSLRDGGDGGGRKGARRGR